MDKDSQYDSVLETILVGTIETKIFTKVKTLCKWLFVEEKIRTDLLLKRLVAVPLSVAYTNWASTSTVVLLSPQLGEFYIGMDY